MRLTSLSHSVGGQHALIADQRSSSALVHIVASSEMFASGSGGFDLDACSCRQTCEASREHAISFSISWREGICASKRGLKARHGAFQGVDAPASSALRLVDDGVSVGYAIVPKSRPELR
ncbi:hypothetical protein SPRG_21254 [Saprolegnia parasitica CBS 223.65]|uniref:Uncharacterized protein n=1 Tax=Saprolegnia parasitica (strain CBS 223.65) TaxID=695850 RepID=A0A067BSU8_SAPPC|nr:hypothetical protein SPRG_21254 [Saprolegnia parasitica CBS 223.65]KDO21333.1 hypothetical protein SPRG_21254 [Saprolegnia parasitica CBS 223.65]|eukprot:XP_012207992.1 hypothetical protein SPRG_21254 [Saprolegnia parasitica CBS 223.65]